MHGFENSSEKRFDFLKISANIFRFPVVFQTGVTGEFFVLLVNIIKPDLEEMYLKEKTTGQATVDTCSPDSN